MADISTGRQRGIVPFVDEATGRLPDQYLPQGVIDLQGDLEQAVTNAAASATAAQQSAAGAASSASQASESASQASGFASTASQAATTATGAASNASESAATAQQSATAAAQSASEAQNAVDGFGLEVGTTTTGEPGSDAAVSIVKQGTKYVADFTIPQGPQGPQGPNGDPGDLTTVAHDDTLTGDGTSGNVLRQAEGSCLKNGTALSLNDSTKLGFYKVLSNSTSVPAKNHRGTVFVSRLPESAVGGQLFFSQYDSETPRPRLFARVIGDVNQTNQWGSWVEFAKTDDLSNYVPLSTYQALEARVQALEAKLANK